MQYSWGPVNSACPVALAVHAVSTGFVRCAPPLRPFAAHGDLGTRGGGGHQVPLSRALPRRDWVPARSTHAGPVLIRRAQESLRQSPYLVTGLRGEYSPTPSPPPTFPLTCTARPGKVLGSRWRCAGLPTTGPPAWCGLTHASMTRPGQALRRAGRTRPPAAPLRRLRAAVLGRSPPRPCGLLSPAVPLSLPMQVEGDPAASRASGERASALSLRVPSRKT